MDLYKYNTSDFLNSEINFNEDVTYFYTNSLDKAIDGNIKIDYNFEDSVLSVNNNYDLEFYYYSDISFVTNLSQIEGVSGQPYYENLNLFNRVNNEFYNLFFDNQEIELINLGGTFINTSITTKTVSYGLTITCIIMFFVGIIYFFKSLFAMIGGR